MNMPLSTILALPLTKTTSQREVVGQQEANSDAGAGLRDKPCKACVVGHSRNHGVFSNLLLHLT